MTGTRLGDEMQLSGKVGGSWSAREQRAAGEWHAANETNPGVSFRVPSPAGVAHSLASKVGEEAAWKKGECALWRRRNDETQRKLVMAERWKRSCPATQSGVLGRTLCLRTGLRL